MLRGLGKQLWFASVVQRLFLKTNSLRTLEGGGGGGRDEEKESEAKTYTRADLRCTNEEEEDQIKQEVVEEAVVHKTHISKAESWW